MIGLHMHVYMHARICEVLPFWSHIYQSHDKDMYMYDKPGNARYTLDCARHILMHAEFLITLYHS